MFQKFIKKERGFALIELLVAIAVASIVIIGSYMASISLPNSKILPLIIWIFHKMLEQR